MFLPRTFMKILNHRKIITQFLLASCVFLSVFLITGCEGANINKYTKSEFIETIPVKLSETSSIEAGIYLNIDGSLVKDSTEKNISISSESTVKSLHGPVCIYADTYSKARTSEEAVLKEELESYIIEEDDWYYKYSCKNGMEDWLKTRLSKKEVATIDYNKGVIIDWASFFEGLEQERNSVEFEEQEDKKFFVFKGTVNSDIFQELMPIDIFDGFMGQIEPLLSENIPCTFYVDEDSFLPYKIELDFRDNFISGDMIFDRALFVVEYSYNEVDSINMPKKISVTAEDQAANFYSNFYAWDVFGAFEQKIALEGSKDNSTDVKSDTAGKTAWDTGEISINKKDYTIPLAVNTLLSAGMKDVTSSSSVATVQPGKFFSGYTLQTGNSTITLELKNEGTAAQPFQSCSIVAIDYDEKFVRDDNLSVVFPGGITLGSSVSSVLSAYGEPTNTIQNFDSVSYFWGIEGKKQLRIDVDDFRDTVVKIVLTLK